MSSGWVPKTTLDKIDAHCRRFWWSKDEEGQELSLASWTGPCRSEAEGGLSFRNMSQFHEALMGKQLAKFFDKPHYGPVSSSINTIPLEMSGNCNPDARRLRLRGQWFSSGQVLRQGLQWELRNGDSISFLNDPLVSICPLKLWPN